MLLNELAKLDRIVKIKGSPDLSKLGDPIGQGAFAKVYKGKEPGTVIKHAKMSDYEDDGYYWFVTEALRNQNNPFFPRIHSAKLYEEKPNKQHLIVKMEKLIPLKNEKVRDNIEDLMHQLGFREGEEMSETSHENAQLVLRLFRGTKTKEARNKLRERSKNPQFIEALDALEDLFLPGRVDTHTGNWMIRPTAHGPQVVLTDPFI